MKTDPYGESPRSLLSRQLLRGPSVRLIAINPEKDAPVFAAWTQDIEFMRLTDFDIARPLTSVLVRKRFDEYKKQRDKGQSYSFAVRSIETDQLLGVARLVWIEWNNQAGSIRLWMPDKDGPARPFAEEALALLLGFAFEELNLYRLSVFIAEYDHAGIDLYERMGFQAEVRQREILERYGRRWDVLILGLLRDDWLASRDPGGREVEG